MNKLPIEIQNKIWGLHYSHIYYTNVILELQTRINICDQIVNNKIRGYSPLISLLEHYSKAFLKVYEKDDVKQRLFQISFYNANNEYKRLYNYKGFKL
jgi:hypothetical protein